MRQEKLWVIVEVLASPAQHFPPYSRGQGKPRRDGIKQSSSTTQMCLFFFFHFCSGVENSNVNKERR